MKFVQYKTKGDENQRLGVLSDYGNEIKELSGYGNDLKKFIEKNVSVDEIKSKLGSFKGVNKSEVEFLSPITEPQKILCVGLNYRGHCDEQNKPYPKEPMFFSKYASALVGPYDPVIAHKISDQIDWEVELAVVISKKSFHVKKENAFDHVNNFSSMFSIDNDKLI